MKKLAGLLILMVLFVLAGCAPDQYSVERKYWRARKYKDAIMSNVQGSPPEQLQKAVAALTDFIRKNPSNRLAIDAELDIATLYILKNEFEKAREHLRGMKDRHSESELICSEASFLIGNSYQVEGIWDLALAEYKKVVQDYPYTIRGLDMPMYIAGYYKTQRQPQKMTKAYKEALEHYAQLNQQHPNSQLAFYSSRLTGRCYMELKDWPKALNAFQGIIATYREKVELDDILMNIAIIYAHELKDIEKASEALEQLVKDYPDSKFIKAAEFMLREWGKK
jgi:tetratricopeptide (TPR) repeat protein